MQCRVCVWGPALRRGHSAWLSALVKWGGFCLALSGDVFIVRGVISWVWTGRGCRSANTSIVCFHSTSLVSPCGHFPGISFPGSQWFPALSECYAGSLHVCTSKSYLVVCCLSRWQTSLLFPSKVFHCWMKNGIYGKLVQLSSKVLSRGKFSHWKSVMKYELLWWVNLQIAVKLVLNDVNMAVQGSAHLIINQCHYFFWVYICLFSVLLLLGFSSSYGNTKPSLNLELRSFVCVTFPRRSCYYYS